MVFNVPRIHIPPNPDKLKRPFGLWSPRYITFHPIYVAQELSMASHCPRKAIFIFRRGEILNWNFDYKRDPKNSGSKFHFQDGEWYNHSKIYKRCVIEILSKLSGKYNKLREIPPNEKIWNDTIQSIVTGLSDSGYCSKHILEDITSFFLRLYNENRLESFYLFPQYFIFNLFTFNPKVTLETNEPIDPTRGVAEGEFPVTDIVDIIDLKHKRIIEIVAHKDSWLPIKDEKTENTIIEDSPERREKMILNPYFFKLWILLRAIQTLPNKYKKGATLGDIDYGIIPQDVIDIIGPWEKFFSGFILEIAAIDKSHVSTKNYGKRIVDGLISCRKAFVGDRFALLSDDVNLCIDPTSGLLRDDHCNMRNYCFKKSIASLFSTVRYEIRRLEEKIFHEYILNTNWDLYRMASYLPNDSVLLNSLHLSFWCGEVVSTIPLRIQLDKYMMELGLGQENTYLISTWSPFFGPEEVRVLKKIDDLSGHILLEFAGESSLEKDSKVVILNPRKSGNLLRRELRALTYHLLRQRTKDLSKKEERRKILMKILEQGGRRTGQAVFGGFAKFQ